MRKWIIWVLLIITVLAPFAIVEVIFRVKNTNFIRPIRVVISGKRAEDFREYHMFSDNDFIPDPYLFWKVSPKHKLSNSRGFIGPEFSIKKPSDVIRIFCLGDSNTMGFIDGSYPFELGCLMQLNPIANKKAEVINAGLSGYTSLQGLRLFSEIVKYKPDMVTICFGWNDPCFTKRAADKMFTVHKIILSLERFFYKFKTYQYLKYIILKLKYKEQKQRMNNVTRRVDLEDYEKNLIEIANLADTKWVKLLFITRPFNSILEPWMLSFIEDTKVYNSTMRTVAARLRIDMVDAEKIFFGHPEYFSDACHFNNRGRRLLAEEIYNYVKIWYGN